MRLHSNLQKRLMEVRSEVTVLREGLGVLDEQIAFQQGVAADAATDAVVQGPLAARESRHADDDVRRTRRQREETAARVAALTAEQDDLLEQLLQRAGRQEVGP